MNARRQQFIREYLIDLNGAAAAIRAGYSQATAKEIAAEILTFPNVRDEIDRKMKERAERTEITADRVIQAIAEVAFQRGDEVLDYSSGEVKVKKASEISPLGRRLIKEIHFNKDGSVKTVKLHDKMEATRDLARHLGLFVEHLKIEEKSTLNIVEVIVEAPASRSE